MVIAWRRIEDMSGAWIAAVYVVMSCIAFAAIGCDKAAASRQHRRIPENRLHLLSFAGGWPGALLAHRLFRHKTQKRAFQLRFRWIIVANCALMGGVLYALR